MLTFKRPISVSTAVEICTNIHSRDIGVRRLPGTYIGNPRTRMPIYTPPTGESVILEKLGNWAEFLNTSEEIDPLVVMAIAHYQFEAIHPFDDGNGRTGRILNVLQLVQAGLLSAPILYLSRYIIQNKDEYYRLLLAVTGMFHLWIFGKGLPMNTFPPNTFVKKGIYCFVSSSFGHIGI